MKTVLCWIVLAVAVVPARAELTPDQVAVIAMAESPESKELAAHYMKARNIPETQILLLEGKPVDTISRQTWETEIRPAIRKWLSEDGRDDEDPLPGDLLGRAAEDRPARGGFAGGGRADQVSRRGQGRPVAQMDKLLGELDALGRRSRPRRRSR